MKSLGAMIQQLHGMVGTQDLTEWETEFVQSVYNQSGQGQDTAFLTQKQAGFVISLFNKHFGG